MDAAAKALTSHETDLAVLSEEKEALQTRLKEEKARLDTQQQSRDKMRIELEESKKREVNFTPELTPLRTFLPVKLTTLMISLFLCIEGSPK